MTTISNNYSQLPPANMDPNAYAQKYATEKGISLEEAKAELVAMYGEPTKPDNSIFESSDESLTVNNISYNDIDLSDIESVTDSEEDSTSFIDLIKELFGINTDDKTKKQEKLDPDEVAQAYADKHNITLDEAKEELAKLYGTPSEQ